MNAHQRYVQGAAYELTNPTGDRVLLLLHGLGGDRNQPLRLVDRWHPEHLTILAPDLRGHGHTKVLGNQHDYRLEAMASDVWALLADLDQTGKPLYIAGISWGAAIALRLALRRLDTLHGVAFIRPAFSQTPNPPNLEALRIIGDLLPRGQEGRVLFAQSAVYQAVAAVSASGAASLREQFDKPLAEERAGRLRFVPGNAAWADPDELQRVTQPTLVLGVERDPVHPIALARQWADLLPNAQFYELPPRDDDAARHEKRTQRLVQDHARVALNLPAPPG